MKEIAEYAAREYTDAGDFGSGLVNLTLPTLTPPQRPDPTDLLALEEFRIDFKLFKEKERSHKANTEKVFFLVLGQCSQSVRDRLEGSPTWGTIMSTKDLIALLRLIRASMYQQAANQAPVHSLLEAEAALHKFRQTENMSNATYLEKVKSLIEVYEHAGGEPGTNAQRVIEFTDLTDVDPDDENEVAAAEERGRAAARENYMAAFLLLHSDPK